MSSSIVFGALAATAMLTTLALVAATIAALPGFRMVGRDRVEMYTGSLLVVLLLAHLWVQAAPHAIA